MNQIDLEPTEILDRVLQRSTGIKVARRLGVHSMTVSRWKTGDRQITDWRHVDGLRDMYRELYAPDPALVHRDTPPNGPGGDNSPGRGEGGNNGKEAPTG